MTDEASVIDGKTEPGSTPIGPTAAPPCVLQIYGGTLGRRYEVGAGGLAVGRDPENDICVDLTTVSRRHARIHEEAGATWVEDLGSTNGTLVNDVAIEGPRKLGNGDQILPITLSVGGASTEPDDDQAALLARLDARRYEAKRAGRNRCVLS